MKRQIKLTGVQGRIFGAVISAGFLALGLFLYFRSTTDTSKWSSVEGTIIDSQISRFNRKGHASDEWWLRVSYEYQVDGVRHEGNRRNLLEKPVRTSLSRRQLEEEKHTDWQTGAKVRVYYDPRNPARSVLDPTPVGQMRKVGILIMIAFGVLGLFGSLFGKSA